MAAGAKNDIPKTLTAARAPGAPLHATAAKARMGHTEPAAGGVGLLAAAAALLALRAGALPHLRALNPLVAAALGAKVGVGAADPHWPAPAEARGPRLALPRQAACAPRPGRPSGPGPASGVSSFAFQGTNAHAVLGTLSYPNPTLAPPSAAAAWRRRRLWYAGAAHALLVSAAADARGRAVALHARLGAPGLGCLLDHRVAGRALLPGAAMFEAAAAAARALQAPPAPVTDSPPSVCLHGAG
jgi:acyl transferase domain-containing protein